MFSICGTYPIPILERLYGLVAKTFTSFPSRKIVAVPAVTRAIPKIDFKIVDLPAPLGPTIVTIDFSGTSIFTPLRILISP